jgi:hypothetical protein
LPKQQEISYNHRLPLAFTVTARVMDYTFPLTPLLSPPSSLISPHSSHSSSAESVLLSPLLLQDREVPSPWNTSPEPTYSSPMSQTISGADHSTLLRFKNGAYIQLHQRYIQYQKELTKSQQDNLVLVTENEAYK